MLRGRKRFWMSNPDQPPPSLWATIQSVLAAFFGVQSRANRERDFRHGRAWQFILVGLLMTVTLIATLIAVVRVVMHNVGG